MPTPSCEGSWRHPKDDLQESRQIFVPTGLNELALDPLQEKRKSEADRELAQGAQLLHLELGLAFYVVAGD
jgi:hypothetical protein